MIEFELNLRLKKVVYDRHRKTTCSNGGRLLLAGGIMQHAQSNLLLMTASSFEPGQQPSTQHHDSQQG